MTTSNQTGGAGANPINPTRVTAIIPAADSGVAILLPVGGSSPLEWTMQAARNGGCADCVVITRDEAVAREALRIGVLLSFPTQIFTPPLTPTNAHQHLATNHPTDQAAHHATANGFAAVILDPLRPWRRDTDIRDALALLREPGTHAVVSVSVTVSLGSLSSHFPQGSALSNHDGSIIVLAAESTPTKEATKAAITANAIQPLTLDRVASLRADVPAERDALDALLHARARASALDLFASIQQVVFDFDGVMSDNRVLVMQDATEGALCNRSDGLGVGMLKAAGIPAMVMSKEKNPVVGARCAKLGLECHQGVDDKAPALTRLLAERGINLSHVAYVGNDINDEACMRLVGLPIAVADAFPAALRAAKYITRAKGGMGAVREVIELLIEARSSRSKGAAHARN